MTTISAAASGLSDVLEMPTTATPFVSVVNSDTGYSCKAIPTHAPIFSSVTYRRCELDDTSHACNVSRNLNSNILRTYTFVFGTRHNLTTRL